MSDGDTPVFVFDVFLVSGPDELNPKAGFYTVECVTDSYSEANSMAYDMAIELAGETDCRLNNDPELKTVRVFA